MNKRYFAGAGLVMLLSITFLSSCGIRTKYKEPELPQNVFREGTTGDTTTIASIPWRTYFSDMYLQSLIDEGLNNSFDMQIAYQRIKQTEVALDVAKVAYFPDLTLVGSADQKRHSVGRESGQFLPKHSESYMLGVSTSWELDIWGKYYKQKRGAVAQYMQSVAYRNLIQTSLIANIATSYYTLVALDEQLKVAKDMAGIMQETVETMTDMRDAGLLNSAAVEQTKSAYYSTLISIPDMEAQIRNLENTICLLVGREPSSILRSTINNQVVNENTSHGIPSQMLARRPDVKMAEWQFRAAFEAVGVAQASFYPSVSISGTLGYSTSNTVSNFFKPENLIANIVGNLAQPIFARNALRGQLKLAKAQQEEALLSFKQTVISAGNEVSDALYSFEAAQKKVELRQKQIDATEKSVEFTKELLKAGLANYTEVLTAEGNLLQARLGEVSDKLAQLQANVTLYRTLGGGLE
ncbi:efflux transporter outer membrane subunit [Dysgonomonas sp. 216]|uniref:efflux transporter outer membrane subunit n=1 Tax=Dysgonomonas sp. 216 TaxID=2302934 RepID=UPI0013D62613|nr:efflux transporter outer membrane subunit [Dysgonomonas sp. 216]NDW18895.1 efflux transporter outer membrane subunit [Dysgonomonas sp. 216]